MSNAARGKNANSTNCTKILRYDEYDFIVCCHAIQRRYETSKPCEMPAIVIQKLRVLLTAFNTE
ncbi:hypothetical protein L798_05179 [Zootermopsis nevadensis]|uniref:Uncharacterized protein n=1 Tax=Zootermopsis nevadensis TaxID=136037 RepID=A0A067RAJ1_ZOONE|nr:hypothetical protein L798_05179 [Zootermopsis nevadensis]